MRVNLRPFELLSWAHMLLSDQSLLFTVMSVVYFFPVTFGSGVVVWKVEGCKYVMG